MKLLAEISTHKAVKEGDKIKIYIKGFSIDELHFEDEFIYCLDSEDDILPCFELLKENNRINLAEFNEELKFIKA